MYIHLHSSTCPLTVYHFNNKLNFVTFLKLFQNMIIIPYLYPLYCVTFFEHFLAILTLMWCHVLIFTCALLLYCILRLIIFIINRHRSVLILIKLMPPVTVHASSHPQAPPLPLYSLPSGLVSSIKVTLSPVTSQSNCWELSISCVCVLLLVSHWWSWLQFGNRYT